MKYLQQLIRDYFGFSRTESRGLFLLLSLICLSIWASMYYRAAYPSFSQPIEDHDKLNTLMGELEANVTAEKSSQLITSKNSKVVKRFRFDPNTASVQDFITLGIPEFLSQRIDKYRSKGGTFYKPEDLLKIYGFKEHLYRELEAYIKIAKKKPVRIEEKTSHSGETVESLPKEENLTKPPEPEVLLFNINDTDSLALQQLRGIGRITASRIIRFRDQLGGIHSLKQLKEVYHISDEALQSLEEYAFVDEKFETRKINVNQADFKTLLAHPYINYEVARAIMNHRRIYGNFTSTEQLKEVYQINEELLVKLLPYLVI